MEMLVAVLPVVGIALVVGARRAGDARAFAPALFATFVVSAAVAFVGVARSDSLAAMLAGTGAAIAAVGVAAIIFWVDAQVALGSSVSDRWHRFEREFWAYVGEEERDDRRA